MNTKFTTRILLTLLALGTAFSSQAQLVLTNTGPTTTPAALVANILGPGVIATNITYSGSTLSKGTFTSTATNIGMPAGIMLSSGQVSGPAAPASNFHSSAMNNNSDPQLAALIGVAANQIKDAAVLEFDFSVASDSVHFQYVFGSEEYNDYVGSNFNDVFGFFITGLGLPPNKNLAIVPGTASTPVSINNVNNGYSAGVSSGPCNNCAYFVDNVNGTTVFMDAFTTVLEAKSVVKPCETYHIKLAVADVGDQAFDSGVMIKTGSFAQVGQIGLFANGLPLPNNDTIYGCPGGTVTLSVNPASNYSWSSGQSTQSITVPVPAAGGAAVQYSAFVTNPPTYTCFAWTTTVWVAAAPPTATISGTNSICTGASTTLSANLGLSYLWSTGATTQNINVSTAGTFTVTVTNGPGCSATSAPFAVTVGAAAANITGPSAICSGASANLQANAGTSYLWSNGQVSQSLTVLTTGTYTVTVTQPGGCTASASKTVTVSTNPTPAITGVNSICAGTLTSFNAGAGYNSYQWSSGQSTQSITPLSVGTYTVTVTNANGCTGTTTQSLAINALPTPAIAGTTSICQGSATVLDAGSPYTAYLWTGGGNTQTLNVNASGTYTVTVTNANGCTGTASKTVVVNLNPVPAITGTAAICAGTNTVFDGGAGYTAYNWSNGAATQTNTISTSGTYTVTVTNANGCTGTASKTLTVNANPIPAVTGNNAVCQGSSTIFNGGAGFTSYIWNNGNTNQTISVNTSGSFTVTVTNANGCTGTSSKTLAVNPNPTPVIAGITSICQGTATNIDAGAGYTSYAWTGGSNTQLLNVTVSGTYTVTVTDGNGCTGSTSKAVVVNALPVPAITGVTAVCQGANANLNAGNGFTVYQWSTGANTQVINPATAGTYTVTVTNSNGCTGSTSQTVAVNLNPTPVVTGVNTICQNANTTFNGGAGYTAYAWSNGNVSQTININTAGVYTVTVTNANGCTGSASNTLAVNPNPTPAITGISSICQGTSTNIDAGAGYASYAWTGGSNTQLLNVTTTGTYTVTVTDGNGCTGSTSQLVNVNALPMPAITGVTAVCQGANANLNAGNGFTVYQWSTGANTQVINPATAGLYTVTVTDGNGCSGSTNVNVVVSSNPTPAITGVNVICLNTPTVFDAGAGYSAYNWSNGSAAQTINPTATGTYTVTVTNASGCTGTTSYNLTVNPLPTPAITGINSICAGTNTTFDAGAGYNVYQWSTGGNTQTVNLNSNGAYTVTVTDVNGCTNSTNYTLTVNALPTPVIAGTNSICAGTSTNFDAGNGYSIYQWSNGSNGQIINTGTSGAYTVTVTDGNGCTGSTNVNLTVNANPTPAITGVNVICFGTPTTFNAGAGYSQYAWSTGGNTQTINPTLTGSYTVTVTDANNCTGTTSYDLIVNALPTPAITGINSICAGTNTTFDAGTGYTNYQWSTGGNTQTVNLNSNGAYTVTVTDVNGCTNSTSYNLTVNALPTPVIAGTNSICAGTSTNFDAGNGYVSYQWSNGSNGQILNTGTSGAYTVTVTDGNGCTGSANINLTVNANPTPAITGVNVICFGTPTAFDAGAGYSQYAWSTGGNTQTINPTATGTYTVTVTDANNCTGTTSYDLIVNALPTPAITGINSICAGTNTTFDAGAGYTNYQWSTGGNAQTVNLNSNGAYTVTVTDVNGCTNSTSYTLTVNALPTPVIAGTNSICAGTTTNFDAGNGYVVYQWSNGTNTQLLNTGTSGTYTVTVTDVNGCSGSTSQNLTVNALPTPTITGNDTICDGFVSVIDAGAGYAGYQWNTGANTQTINITTAGNYTVMVTDGNGCTGTTAFKLEVLTAEATITAGGPTSFCFGDQVTLSANTGLTYLWSNGATSKSIVVVANGVFTVIVLNNNGCSATSAPMAVSVHPYPTVRFTNDTSTICGALRVHFNNLSTYEPGSAFKWEFGDGTYSAIAGPTHDYGTVGVYIVHLTITSPYGCKEDDYDTIQVTFPPEAIPLFTMSTNLAPLFEAKVDFLDKSINAYTWFWSFGDGDTSTERNPSHYYDKPGDFNVKLQVTNIAGCEKEYMEHLTIAPFWIPNAFSPNGDGKNDLFFTSNYVLDVLSFDMVIRNRWGQVVYETQDFTKPWDGRGNDESISQEGVYVYDVYVKTKTGREYNFKGTVDLIR